MSNYDAQHSVSAIALWFLEKNTSFQYRLVARVAAWYTVSSQNVPTFLWCSWQHAAACPQSLITPDAEH